MMRTCCVGLMTMALCTALLLATAPAEAGTFKQAAKNGVPDVYLVLLAEGVASKPGAHRPDLPSVAQIAQGLGRAHGGQVEEVWEDALQGFLIRMPEARARKLADDPRVRAVDQDFWISAPVGDCYYGTAWEDTRPLPSSTSSPQILSCTDPDPLHDTDPAQAPPRCKDNWGLDRIDQMGSTRDNLFSFTNDGTTVHVYVMDTGIRATHRELLDANGAMRVTGGANAESAPVVPGTPANTDDCNGHGTHVAAIIGGRTYGIAKNVHLHPVHTSCTASYNVSNFVRGLNWIFQNAERPAVINWSGGNDTSVIQNTAVRTEVQNVLNANIVLVQAAGNQSPDYDPADPAVLRDACDYSFGGLFPGVIVAAGMDEYDGRWTRRADDDPRYCGYDCGSNGGSCVDIWAPAAHVISASRTGDDWACRLSGTSMAAAHVTGVVAVYLQSHPNATVAEVERALRSRGTWGLLETNPGDPNYIGDDSDNVLVYSDTRLMGSDLPPVASYSWTCSSRICTFDATSSTDDVGIVSYDWRFGDGTTASGSVVQHVFPAYFSSSSVTLKVTDTLQHTDHLSKTVPVNDDAPTAFFTFSCTGRTCTFDASGSTDDHGIASRTWTFGDGTSDSGQVVTYTYPASGGFTVELTVTDMVGQTAKKQSIVTVDLQAPSNVVATASGGIVSITWTPAAGADSYDVERKVAGAGWAVVQTVNGGTQSSASDAPVSASGVVLYRVVARAGTGRSGPSNKDVAYVGTFTDDPVLATSPYTAVKAAHIIELRRAVNGLREVIGLAPVYSGAALDGAVLRGQPVDDADFTTLLANLNAARTDPMAGLPPVSFRTAPAQGQIIRRTQLEDLRSGVK
jgi:PKD repeat protein